MLDATAGLVENDPNKLDQRRAGVQAERLGNIRCCETRADTLACMLDLHAGVFKQFQQRPRARSVARNVSDTLSGTCVVR